MYIKDVRFEDMEFLYSLMNHPEIRKFSHSGSFTYDDHLEYWKYQLRDTDFHAGIIMEGGLPVGCIRRDENLISIAILPEYQGKGIGTEALLAFCKPGDIAEILFTNPRSARTFQKAGFREKYTIYKKEEQ